MVRGFALTVGLMAALPAVAGEMTAEEARRFVIGKIFNYTCFEGTRGQGRVNADGSVTGSIQFQGAGDVRHAHLPANTLQVRGEAVCASLRGLPIQPCFNLDRTSVNSFRGSVSGLGFAYCDFTRHGARTTVAHSVQRTRTAAQPLGLRPSLAADNNN
jgi:hypothetical protein